MTQASIPNAQGAAAPAPATAAAAASPATPAANAANGAVIQKIKDGVKAAVLRGEFEVPSLPNVTAEVMKLMNNPNVGLANLEQVIKQDPAMTARIIKMANSVMYRGAMEITSLQQAMARIGLKNVKDVVITLGIQSKAFNIANFEDILAKIWENSISTAVVAQSLAKSMLADKEASFLAGLLSNIGKPVLVQICSKVENREKLDAQSKARQQKQNFDAKTWRMEGLRETILPQAMEELHHIVGAAVGGRWGLPDPIMNSIKFMTDPAKAPEANQKLAWVICLSHKISRHLGFGCEPITTNFETEPGLEALGISITEFNEMLEDLPDQVAAQVGSFKTV